MSSAALCWSGPRSAGTHLFLGNPPISESSPLGRGRVRASGQLGNRNQARVVKTSHWWPQDRVSSITVQSFVEIRFAPLPPAALAADDLRASRYPTCMLNTARLLFPFSWLKSRPSCLSCRTTTPWRRWCNSTTSSLATLYRFSRMFRILKQLSWCSVRDATCAWAQLRRRGAATLLHARATRLWRFAWKCSSFMC